MDTQYGHSFEQFFKQKTSYKELAWDNYELPNMVVTIGDDPQTGKKSRFLDCVPCTKIRPKDDRGILVFTVNLAYRPFVSPFSGGMAYSVLDDGKNVLIQQPEDDFSYPKDLKNSVRWILREVHIGEDPEYGKFVGIILYFETLGNDDKPIDADFVYFQWCAEPTCPPIFYGWYPDGWLDVDPEYLKLHKETLRLAQKAAKYTICDDINCCVRYGCKRAQCCEVSESNNSCHIKEQCLNYGNKYEILLQECLNIQQKAYHDLFEKIPNPLPELQDHVILAAFRDEFLKPLFSTKEIKFWAAWMRAKVHNKSDFKFITNWRIQEAKDNFTLKSVEAAFEAEAKWSKLLLERNKPTREELQAKIKRTKALKKHDHYQRGSTK